MGDSFEHEANSPNPSFGSGQLPAGWAKHLQQLQQQQQADKAGLGYIPLGPCDADWTYSPNKPSQGSVCWELIFRCSKDGRLAVACCAQLWQGGD